ncbi:hypothetical protein [Acanthopleuribacter pedis]|uniref:NnrS family protein n=1 Tax=Acanthopleuribacter pedis TaxID=442870 RepID=A0A8J7Q8E0_9BACT|nr:hypothetical protein [Acanthopleuribacter pedis]MBO1318769.1 hypothetical protein [Acanthopleuribacter pedis]
MTPLSPATWRGVILCLAVAVGAGFLFRMSLLTGFSLHLGHVRHAHSHLMSFGWVIPAVWLLILPQINGKPLLGWAKLSVALGALSFPLFWRWGYGKGLGLPMPPAVIVSTLNMAAWYGFGAAYVWVTRSQQRTLPIRCFDLALVFLFLACLGAWGITLIHRFPTWHLSPKLLSTWFLFIFKEGFCLFAVAGFLLHELGPSTRGKGARLALASMALGTPLCFLINLPEWAWLGCLGGVLSGLGLLTLILPALRSRRFRSLVWMPPLLCLALKAILLLLVCLTGKTHLTEVLAYKRFYLHLLMLGGVSGCLLAHGYTQGYVRRDGLVFWHLAAIGNMAALLLLSPLLNAGGWAVLYGPPLSSFLPLVAAFYLLRPRQRQPISN